MTLFAMLLVFFVGLRFEIGPDWYQYVSILEFVYGKSIPEILSRSEPSYIILNWITSKLGFELWFVNSVCAIISIYSLRKFCIWQNRPWLSIYIATCYFVIVIVMGLTRQGTSLSITFLALTYLFQKRQVPYIICIIFAASFHYSSIIMLPLIVIVKKRSIYTYIFSGILFSVLIAFAAYGSLDDKLNNQYFVKELNSYGAYPRFVFHILAATLFFFFNKRFRANPIEKRTYTVMSFLAFFLFAALLVAPSSTFIDRLAFYLTPLQMFVFSNLPNVIRTDRKLTSSVLFLVMTLYLLKFTFWINIGSAPERFLPYKNFISESN